MSTLNRTPVFAILLALSVVACEDPGSSAEALIDDRGGRVEADRGAAIEVPPGAVDAPTRFTIEAGSADHLAPDLEAIGPMITFGPEGVPFATSVRIEIPATREPMVLLTRPRGGDTWTRVDGAVWDAEASVVRADVAHFSDFVPVSRAGGASDAGPGPADAGAPDAGDPCVLRPRDPACVPTRPVLPSCDAIAQDCAAGEMCVATDQESGYDWGDGRPAWCIPAGAAPSGAPCTAPSDCSPGTQCVIQTMFNPDERTIWYSQEARELPIHGGTCMELCLHATPRCPAGELCHPIQLWGFSGREVNEVVGVCAPPPTGTPRP